MAQSALPVLSAPLTRSVPYILLEEEEKLPQEFGPLVEMAEHMSDDKTVSRWKASTGSVMLRYMRDGIKCQLTVKPCLPEPTTHTPFLCGAASIVDSLAVYYVNGLTTAGLVATIHRTVTGHPIVEVMGRGMFRVELSQ